MQQYGVKKAVNSHQKGFTLIELSVVIVIIGIIISAIATVLPSLIYSSKIKKARAVLEKIDYAVQGYAIANNRLPFAAGANDGLETTDTFVGYLPYQSLGLSSGQDPWGNAIRYAVYGIAGGAANLTATFADRDAFCTALTQASIAAFDNTIAHTTTAAACGSADSTNSANQAYILISGGAKDLDGAAGFFDACNDPATTTFNAPNKIIDNSYDDLTVAFSINELIQRICSGGGGGSGAAGENTYANGCTNGSDDDGDGAVDCADSDCAGDPACAGGSVTITTTTIPSADLNSAYTTTINATGGLTPYQWTLTNNGGFTGLALNSFSGQLSGPLDQCPGTYNIIVDIQDNTLPADGGPLTDSATLALTVTSNLSVAHTSGGGSVTWSSALQTETFQATGDWLGTLNWTLNSGGAAGFAVKSSGSDGAILYKTGSTATGAYTFTITATDSACPTNSADSVISVDVQPAGAGVPGGISGIVATRTYNYPAEAYTPKLVSLGGSVFAVTHRSQSGYDNGYLRTTEIGMDGTITAAERDYTFFNYIYNAWGNPVSRTTSVFDPDTVKVSDTITAAAFTSANGGGQGYLHTISVDSSGTVINDGFEQSLVFEAVQCSQPDLIHVSGDIYAIVYTGPDGDGYIKTVSIDGSTGAMTLTGSVLEFDTANGLEPSIVKVGDGLFAVAYRGSGNNGDMKSLSIDAAGVITELDGLSGGFDNNCYEPALIAIDSTTLAVAYSGSGSDGWLKTISIDASGMLSLTGSELEFDNNYGNELAMVYMGADIYAVAYQGPNNDGWLKTVSIDAAGALTYTGNSLEFDPADCYEPSIVQIDYDTAAIFYRGPSNQGTLVTVGFQ